MQGIFSETVRPLLAQWTNRADPGFAPGDLREYLHESNEKSFFWQDAARGKSFLAVGELVSLKHGEILRPDHLDAVCSEINEQLRSAGVPGNVPAILFVLGRQAGLAVAFDDAAIPEATCVWLPRLVFYRDNGLSGILVLAYSAEEMVAWQTYGTDLLASCRPPSIPEPESLNTGIAEEVELDTQANWRARVCAAQQQIQQGVLEKLVLTRRVMFPLAGGFPGALPPLPAGLTEFAIGRPGRALLVGQTPETLFQLQGSHLKTHALAGTLPAGADLDAFLRSSKLCHEHDWVVQGIVQALESGAQTIQVGDPAVMQAGSVAHMQTPIHATVDGARGAFEWIQHLHPTPALGGYPQAAVWPALAELEPYDRGWFGAPAGFLTVAGEADVRITIRSAWLTPTHAYALVGAGIVADSDPDDEWEETQRKLDNMRRLIGAAYDAV